MTGPADGGAADDGSPEPGRALLVVPVPDATRVANLCLAVGIDADVVPAGAGGSVVVPGPGADVTLAVQALSRLLGQADVLLLRRRAGQVEVERWRANALQDAPAPGLVLSALPEQVERLLLTESPPSQLAGAVTTAQLGRGGRAGALWRLVRGARRSS